ncbi:unnamed protein product [marine sediment metagenome]|uniref:Uncharacterized protein n=1 Tax=marine sediment metagenome TaxID=412755 RepID=X0ZA26_9ZZZZ
MSAVNRKIYKYISVYNSDDIGITMKKEKTKIQMMWEVSREQEVRFREGMAEEVNGINVADLFKLIRGSEYRRGKEDANAQT